MRYVTDKLFLLMLAALLSGAAFGEAQTAMSCSFPTVVPGNSAQYASTVDISAITQANPGVVTTSAAHGLTAGDLVKFMSVGGMTELNGNFYTVGTVSSTTQFQISGTNTTGFGAFTSGGTVLRVGYYCDQASGGTAHSEGDYFISPGGVIKVIHRYHTNGDRFDNAGLATNGSLVRLGTKFDSFHLLQSLLTSNYFTTVSSNTAACPSDGAEYNWLTVRMRTNDAPSSPQDIGSANFYVGGKMTYDTGALHDLTVDSVFNLAGTTATPSFYFDGFSGDSCPGAGVRKYRLQKGGTVSDTYFDKYQTVYFGTNSVVMISAKANPTIVVGVTYDSDLTVADMQGLRGNVFSGLLTRYDDATTQVQKNIYLYPDATNGNTFTMRQNNSWSDYTSYSEYGEIACTSRNTPANGFCSGTMTACADGGTLDGALPGGKCAGAVNPVTSSVVCAVHASTTTESLLVCTSHQPGTSGVPLTVIAQTPKRALAQLELSTPAVSVAEHTSDGTITVTVSNVSGRKIVTLGNPADGGEQLAAPWTNTNAFGDGNGTCEDYLDAFSSCTFDVTYNPTGYLAHSRPVYVAYDAQGGEGTKNASETLKGVAGLISISISPGTGFYTNDSSKQLTATATFRDGTTQNISNFVDWSADNNNVVDSISSSGVLDTSATPGNVTFTAAFGAVMSGTLNRTVQGDSFTGREVVSYSGASPQGLGVATADYTSGSYIYGGFYTTNIPTTPAAAGGYTGCEAFKGTAATDTDAVIMQFDDAGTPKWCKTLGGVGAGTETAWIYGMVADSTRKALYVYGRTSGGLAKNAAEGGGNYTLTGTQDVFVTKYWSDGTHAWTRQWGSAGRTPTNRGSIAIDVTNNRIFVSGTMPGSATGRSFCNVASASSSTNDAFMFTLDGATGNIKNCNLETEASADITGSGVAVDSDGRPYLAGQTNQDLNSVSKTGSIDLYLVKHDNDVSSCSPSSSPPCNAGLTVKWTYLNGVAAKNTEGRFVMVDNDKNAYIAFRSTGGVAGQSYRSSSSGYDIGVLKVNAASSGTALSYNITGITRANPAVVTATAHGFVNGDIVYIQSVAGMTEVNGNYYKVANKAANTFELNSIAGVAINSSSYTAYSSGGTAGGLVLGRQIGSTYLAASGDTDQRGMCIDRASGYVYVTSDYLPNTAAGAGKGFTDGTYTLDFTAGATLADSVITQWALSGTSITSVASGVASYGTHGRQCAVDNAGNVYMVGMTRGNLDGVSLTAGTPNGTLMDGIITRFEVDLDDSNKIKKK